MIKEKRLLNFVVDVDNIFECGHPFFVINGIIYVGVDSMLSPKLETERLILRRYKESDIDMQYEVLTVDRLAKYIKFPNLTKEEELDCIKDWIKNADDSKYEKWVITLKEIEELKKENLDLRIYLGASKGKEGFYERFGFIKRIDANLGYGMILNK